MMSREGQVVLADGRTLAFTEFGPSTGRPVFYFHGAPSSRLEPSLVGEAVFERLNLRIISPDRPGMGHSDFQPSRSFSDWPADMIVLADFLDVKRFSVLGNSGGAGYAVACAALIPERLDAAVIVSGAWQMNRPEAKGLPFINRLVWLLAEWAPWLLRLLLNTMRSTSPINRHKELSGLKARVPAADYQAFESPGRLEAFVLTLRESLRQNTMGATWDMQLYVKPLDFRLDQIHMPLHVFHGALDMNVPLALVRSVLAGIPGATLAVYAQDAHLSMLCNHFEDFAEVISGASTPHATHDATMAPS